MANDHLDGSWYVWIHSLLIAGSILMLFPFVWMVSTSFKSQAEILSEDESIVLLPDILRPSIFDGEADTRRKQRRQEQMSAWQPIRIGRPSVRLTQRISLVPSLLRSLG